jgi:hypothetical protein
MDALKFLLSYSTIVFFVVGQEAKKFPKFSLFDRIEGKYICTISQQINNIQFSF